MNGFDGGLPDNRKRKSPSRGAGNSTAVHVSFQLLLLFKSVYPENKKSLK